MSDVAAIILDIDGGEMLRACVASLHGFSDIVVFDNGSQTPARIEGARVIRSETNLGFAEGVNRAYATTSAEFVALINNDVVLDPGWLAAVMRAFDDDVAAAQAIIRRDDQTIDGAGIDISEGTIRQIGHGAAIGSKLARAWGVSATAAVYRRKALGERVFDPRFFAYYEDVELNARLHESHWRTVVVPEVLATHRGSASAPILGSDALRLRTRNRYYVARMHRGVGNIGALIAEDVRLMVRGQSSLRGLIEGLCSPL